MLLPHRTITFLKPSVLFLKLQLSLHVQINIETVTTFTWAVFIGFRIIVGTFLSCINDHFLINPLGNINILFITRFCWFIRPAKESVDSWLIPQDRQSFRWPSNPLPSLRAICWTCSSRRFSTNFFSFIILSLFSYIVQRQDLFSCSSPEFSVRIIMYLIALWVKPSETARDLLVQNFHIINLLLGNSSYRQRGQPGLGFDNFHNTRSGAQVQQLS